MSSCGLLSDMWDQVILGSYFWDFPWNHMDKNYVFTWKMRISCVFLTSAVGTLRKAYTSACLVKAGYLMDWIVINKNFFSSAIIYKWETTSTSYSRMTLREGGPFQEAVVTPWRANGHLGSLGLLPWGHGWEAAASARSGCRTVLV